MTPWVVRIIAVTVGVYALQQYSPLVTEALVFSPQGLLFRPWSLVTYMLLHGSFSHILFNMLVLFFFGGRVESRLGGRRFMTLYLVSGVSGAILSMVLSPAGLIGASAGTYGVMMAFAMFWPRERIYIWGVLPVEARVLVIVTTGIALFSGFNPRIGGNIAHFAHLGGYAGAWIYLWWIERNSGAKKFRRKFQEVTPAVKRAVQLNRDQLNLQGVHELTRAEVDRILDKINGEGMSALTPQELQFLSNFAPADDRA